MRTLFTSLNRFERTLWLTSVVLIAGSFLFSGGGDPMTILASLIGVTALIFVAKGYVAGQVLTVVFALVYGIISFRVRYYGEMITYLGMTAPIAALTALEWLRHPFQGSREVEVKALSPVRLLGVGLASVAVTVLFYFILAALGNANLMVSTLSVTTSFAASALTFLRSPYYAVGYAANDLVLVALWVMALAEDPSCLPMVVCFLLFFANDLYGFFNWRRMARRQAG